MNYNQEYIDQFGEEYLLDCLKTKNSNILDDIYNSYSNEFSTNDISDAELLLVKESIDHLIVKKINEDDNFIYSEEFKNYCTFIKIICFNSKFNRILTELFTNPVFLDQKTNNILKDIIISRDKIERIKIHINNVNNYLKQILIKMSNKELITQEELDSICRILARKNTPSDKNYQIVITYILNYMRNYPTLEINLNELAFVSSVLPHLFLERQTPKGFIKKVRIRIGDIVIKNKSRVNAFYSETYNCVVMGKKLAEKCTSLEKGSIYNHRELSNLSDIYSYIFICNHELTHASQNMLAQEKEYSSIGLFYIINRINNDRLGDYRQCNHDSDEIEINADEIGWANTLYILNRYVNEDRELFDICSDNVYACVIRRSISHKKEPNSQAEAIYHGIYDIRQAKESIKNSNDKLFKTYPSLSLIFDRNGETNYKCLCIKGFVDNWDRIDGTSEHSFGNEMGHYIVISEGRKLIDYIKNDNFSYEEILQLLDNLKELLHADAYYLRRLNDIDIEKYNNTKVQFDLENNLNYIYTYFICRNMITINNLRKICDEIKNKYPSISDHKIYYNSWNKEYFDEIMSSTDTLDDSFSEMINSCLNVYKERGDTYLKNLANEIETRIKFTNNTNASIQHRR